MWSQRESGLWVALDFTYSKQSRGSRLHHYTVFLALLGLAQLFLQVMNSITFFIILTYKTKESGCGHL